MALCRLAGPRQREGLALGLTGEALLRRIMHLLGRAHRFMLEQNLAKTMLEFQELMTVFQVMMVIITITIHLL